MKRKLLFLSLILIVGILLFLFWDLSLASYQYALSRRIPKVVAILLTGSAIGFSSLVFQTITNNRILTPSVLGLDSLYVFIQTTMIFLLGSQAIAKLDGRIGFLIAVGVMICFSVIILGWILKKVRGSIYLLLLVGIVTGTLFRSGSSFLQVIIDPNEFLILQGSMFASFNNINTGILVQAGVLMVGAIVIGFLKHQTMDVLALGRDSAINLGVNYNALTKQILLIVAILVSVSTALVGPITFLGVLVTNLAREYLKTHRHFHLLIGSMLVGCIALIFGQLLVEQVFHFNTPISVMINFIGGLYFIRLLLKESQL